MEGWLIFVGVVVGLSVLGWLFEKISEYNKRVKSEQRDEIAVSVIAEYGLEDDDKNEVTQKFDHVIKSIPRRLTETEPYEIITSLPARRRQGMLCPKCEVGYLVRRQGKYGYFLGCSRYPLCNSTKPVSWTDKRAKTEQKNRYAKEFLEDLKKAYS